MITADAVLSVTFVDRPAAMSTSTLPYHVPQGRSARTDRIVAVAPIRGLAAVPASGNVFDMMAHAHLAADSVVALQPDDV